MHTNRSLRRGRLAGAIATLLVLAGCAAAPQPPAPQTPPSDGVMCTQDVRQCPDGRFVGRTPPGCQFVCTPAAMR